MNRCSLISILGSLLCFFVVAPNVVGQVAYNSAKMNDSSGLVVGVGLSLSEVEYELDDADQQFEAERKVFGAEFSKGMGSVNVFGLLGIIIDGELSSRGNKIDDGKGFVLGGGVKGLIHDGGSWRANWHSALTYLTEEYDDDVDVDITLMEIFGGATGSFIVSPAFAPYVGLTIFPYSDGEYEAKVGRNSSKDDIERDDIMTLLIGTNLQLDSVNLRPELVLIGEKTFSFYVEFAL